MGAAEVTAFLSDLAIRRNVAASTQNQALHAILFLYRDVLKIKLPWLDEVQRAKRPQHLPVVFTQGGSQSAAGSAAGNVVVDGDADVRQRAAPARMSAAASQGCGL